MKEINEYFDYSNKENFVPRKKSFGKTPLDELPLAMAYVPFQKLGSTYEQTQALSNGTLFPELFKPFYGNKCGRRD